MTATLLTMLLTSCVTERIVEKPVVPELYFPRFPTIDVIERTENGVVFGNQSVVDLAEYKIRIEETEKNYTEMKELYNEAE